MRTIGKIVAVAVVLVALLLPAACNSPTTTTPQGKKAAIVDQLYLREPNPTFIAQAKQTLESYGFTVDVWQGSQITVDFYRNLPAMGYKFILLRVHSGLLVSEQNGKEVTLDTTYLFTAENYSTTKYVTEQLTDKVSNAMMEDNSPLVFAVNSDFITSAKGRFDHTVVLAMGCESYEYDDLPKAFAAKGAAAYIGWSDVVTLEHVDTITLDLLRNLCTKDMPLAQGIADTTQRLGKDPYFDSYMKYYPAVTGNETIDQIIQP